ncbi:hypothetical protein VNO77_02800 [Canavalia gladiata]|uniref:Uncharacterized protein n=1 Tax=Canavalia gladiata TaxID=3824 RepID=A0AAN9R6E8_CANGL
MQSSCYSILEITGAAHSREGRLAGKGSRLREEKLKINVHSDVYGYTHSRPHSFKSFRGHDIEGGCPSGFCVEVSFWHSLRRTSDNFRWAKGRTSMLYGMHKDMHVKSCLHVASQND